MYYKKTGRSLAWLIDAGVTHLGKKRSNFNTTRPPLRWVIWNKHVLKAVQSTQRRIGHYSRLLGLSDGF
ncbi:hypothetical protein BH10PSE9_BH10PSE9_09990 [soil metagenome]